MFPHITPLSVYIQKSCFLNIEPLSTIRHLHPTPEWDLGWASVDSAVRSGTADFGKLLEHCCICSPCLGWSRHQRFKRPLGWAVPGSGHWLVQTRKPSERSFGQGLAETLLVGIPANEESARVSDVYPIQRTVHRIEGDLSSAAGNFRDRNSGTAPHRKNFQIMLLTQIVT